MSITNFPQGVSSFGLPVMGGGGIPAMYGDVWFVDARNGSDDNDGKSKDRAFKTLSQAHTKATSNNNDVVLIDGDSQITEDSMITWSKNRIHVVGLGGGFMTGQRSRLGFSTTGNASVSAATITLTGVGNTFSNLKIENSGTDATSVAAVIDAGEANVWYNCSFMKFSDLNVAAVADFICRSDSTTYKNCEFGFDTLVQSAARATFWIKNDGATRAKHINMIDCHFTCSSSATTKSFILVSGTSALAFSNIFTNCTFSNALVSSTGAVALADAITSVSGLVEGNMLFVNPASDTTEFCSTVTDQVKTYGPVTSAQAGEAGTPA